VVKGGIFMNVLFKRTLLVLAAVLFAALTFQSASAYSYAYPQGCYGCGGYPIYAAGYYHSTWSYGWSGWGYNRVYYNYHYPYSTYNYYNHPSYGYGGYWNAHYLYRTYPVAVAYPYPGYYW
jgi:hypothetical protein